MTKYRTMAQPGSFSAGQLKTNDKKQRDILNTMNDTTRAMQENQSFLQGQQELFLRAQQFAQGEEQRVRDLNFETETDSRQRLKESITQDYQTQITNEEIASKQKLAGLKGLEAFSKTAFKVSSDIINDGINKRRQAYSALVARTGLDARQLQDIQALDNNLTESAFMQSQAILDLKASGTSEEDINAIYHKVYKDGGSLAWIDNKAVARNSVQGFELALEEAKAANPTATGTELKAIYESLYDSFVGGLGDGSGRQFTPEFLETTVNGKLRSALNEKVIEATKLEGKENLANVEVKLGQAFDNTYRGGGGADGLMRMLSKNPNSRKNLISWLDNSIKSGALTPSEVESILKTKLVDYEGGDKRFVEAYGGTAEVAELIQSINNKYKSNNQALRQRQSDAVDDTNNEILRRGNAAGVDDDGVIDAEEFEAIKAWALSTGIDPAKLTALERVRKDTKGAKERIALEAYIQELRKDGNWNLDTMRSLDLPSDLFMKYESYAIAGSKLKTDPKVKEYKTTFNQMLANAPPIVGANMQKSAGVSFMTDKFTEDFRKEVDAEMARMANAGIAPDFDTAAETASKTIERKISEFIAKPSNISSGEYTPFLDSFKNVSDDERKRLSLRHNINEAVKSKKWGEVYKAIDKESFIEFQQQNQGQVNPVAELIAATMNNGLTAEQVHNKIASKFGIDPLEALSETRQSINESIPKILNRYKVFDRIPERMFAYNSPGTAPRREAFAQPTGAGTAAPDDTNALVEISSDLGINPLDLATIIGFETGGSYSPDQIGGDGNNYRGLIQFGPSEQRKYGIIPGMSFRNQLTAVAQFLRDRFAGVGMDTQGASLEDLYTTVLAGNPKANRHAQDSNGTSAISGVGRMGPHREAARKRYGLE